MNNSFVKIQRIWDSNVEQMGLEILKELINTMKYIYPLLSDFLISFINDIKNTLCKV